MNLNVDCITGRLDHVTSYYKEIEIMRSVKIPTENIVLPDRIGKWYIADIDRIIFSTSNTTQFEYLALLEHQTYGDMAGMILAFFDVYSARWIELTETWDDIQTTAEGMCLI